MSAPVPTPPIPSSLTIASKSKLTHGDDTGPFLTSTTPTTYRILLSPYTSHLRHTIPSLLALNRQIHAEAAKVLYSTYTFSFHTCIEAAVPFFSDLTPVALAHVRHISLTKKALPYTKEFDRAEWAGMCGYLAEQRSVKLHSLRLNVVAGQPASGWDDVTPISVSDFQTIRRMRLEWGVAGGVDLEWAEQFMAIKGVRSVSVKALVEHCARVESERGAFWAAFSRSAVEGGFGEWVRGGMLE
jgi:hypothetical protein